MLKSPISIFLCLILLGSGLGCKMGARGSSEDELIAAEKAWCTAEVSHQPDALGHLMADEVVLTGPDGNVYGKKAEVSFTADPTTHFDSLDQSDVKVQMHGHFAVVIGAYHEKGRSQGKAFEHRGRFTDTWMRKNGAWQCVAGHSSVAVPE